MALVFAVTHAFLSWGYIGKFWLDSGRWLHEVDRFARGEVLYRDFVWPFPPLAMWILGGVARFFGSDLGTIWTITSIVFVLLALLYCVYIQDLVERSFRWLALLAGLLLATAHANWDSGPLPTGMYTPAAPIGFLFLFAALICYLKGSNSEHGIGARGLTAACVGLLCGLAVLTKQDFWAPALLLAAWAGCEPGLRAGFRVTVEVASVWALFLTTVAVGIAIVGVTAGWTRLGDIADGFGRVAEFGGRPFPSWERITIQLTGAALVCLVGLPCLVWGRSLSLREARRWLWLFGVVFLSGGLLHAWMSFAIASRASAGVAIPPSDTLAFMLGYAQSTAMLLRGSVACFLVRLENNLFPALLPAGMLIGLLACRRGIKDTATWRTLVFLTLFCLAARLRRGFEHVEWFHLLLELPVSLACASLMLREQGRENRRGMQAALVALLPLGLYFQVRWGQDSLLRGKDYRCVQTPRGTACLEARQAEQYYLLQESLDRLDPHRNRPLLAFGYSGGHNYFLDRPNPTPLEEGFQLSGFPPELVLARLRSSSPAPILIDTDYYQNIRMPAPWLSLAHWELPSYLNVHMRVDRQRFEQALEGCTEFERIRPENGPEFVLYDCVRVRD